MQDKYSATAKQLHDCSSIKLMSGKKKDFFLLIVRGHICLLGAVGDDTIAGKLEEILALLQMFGVPASDFDVDLETPHLEF